ncbi:hypothetical protein NX059_008030 [Plenodomus lindquistii]|nr:hypothetical protein NX059_008030 [Plenodomus lindquistii]
MCNINPPLYSASSDGSALTTHGENALSSASATTRTPALDFAQRIEKRVAEYSNSPNVFKRWLFEIASWAISALCMGSIIRIYLHINEKNMSDSEQLLTLVNILGKVASATLILPTSEALGQLKWNWFRQSNVIWDFDIFDKASRGAWGAALLLYRTKGRSLAALGALLIVLLLAIDTFFQQVINLPDRWILESTAATAPFTVFYDPHNLPVFQSGYELATGDPTLSLTIDKFAYGNGSQPVKFGAGTRPDIQITCSTSNCTWPLYKTLGICSQCADVSSEVTFACLQHTVDWKSNLDGIFDLQVPYPNATGCGYFLNATSSSPTLLSGYLLNPADLSPSEALLMRTLPLTTLTTKEPLYGNGSIHFKHLQQTLVDVIIASSRDGSADAVYRNETPVIQECVLSWCVQTILSSYNWGEYSEEVVERSFNTTPGPFPWLAIPYENEIENGTDIFYEDDITIQASSSNTSVLLNYGTSNSTANSIIQSFIDIFPAYTTVLQDNPDEPLFRFKTWKTGAAFSKKLEFNPWLAPNNVTRHMERFATAITNVIRSAPSRQEFEGMAFNKKTFISVQWEWLIFPLLLLVLSFAFLVSTIIKTSKDSFTELWKTSAMPALIYGLPKETQDRLASSSTQSSENGTKKLKVRLSRSTGWRVSGQEQVTTSPRMPPAAPTAPRGWI